MLFGIRGIEESSVYQGIFRKGEAKGAIEEARKTLLRQGRKKLGPPRREDQGGDQRVNRPRSTSRPDRPHPGCLNLGRVTRPSRSFGVSLYWCPLEQQRQPKMVTITFDDRGAG